MNGFIPLSLAADNPVDHVVNHATVVGHYFGIEGFWLWSAHAGNLLLSSVLVILVMLFAASRIQTGPAQLGARAYVTSNPLAHMIEVILVYLRDKTVRPLLHDRTDRFMPFLWTVFLFILFNNLLGLVPVLDLLHLVGVHRVPVGGTATGNLAVTAVLAIVAAIVINAAGLINLGPGGYVAHLTAGTPWYLWPLMVPIEIMGTVIKPVALALRLFANMNAGHILLATLMMFAKMGIEAVTGGGVGAAMGAGVSLISVIAGVAIYFLELFVAFLQAFVFTFLTTVFISQLSHHHDHDEEHGHVHGHGEGRAAAH